MRRLLPAGARRLPLALLGLVAALLATSGGVRAADDLLEVRRRFLVDRDTCALAEAILDVPARDPYARGDALLAMLACDRDVSPDSMEGVGYEALPAVVAYLKRMDLEGAADAAQRVGTAAAGGIGVWAAALVDARRGDDASALARLRTLPALPEAEVDRASFTLAIFGAAIPRDDRLLLAGVSRAALLAAVREERYDRVVALARSAAALDNGYGGEVFCLGLRALRRAGRMADAAGLAAGPEAQGIPSARPCLELERALFAWRNGEPDSVRRLAATLFSGTPRTAALIAALRRCTSPVRLPPAPVGPVDVAPEARVATLLARFASLLGLPATPEDVVAAALAAGLPVGDPALARVFLEGRGCRVFVSAGGAGGAEAALAAQLPFLLYRIDLRDETFEEVPELVRGRDAGSGWWIADPMELSSPDAFPAEAPRKARLLVAVPPTRTCSVGERTTRTEQLLGRVLTSGVERAARDGHAAGLGALDAQAPNVGGEIVYELYRAFLLYRHFQETDDPVLLQLAADALDRPVRSAPRLSFEQFVTGESRLRYALGPEDVRAALDGLAEAQRLEADSAYIARARFLLLRMHSEPREALEALELARSLDPFDATTLYFRGRLRIEGGNMEGARQDLRRALDRRPGVEQIAVALIELELEDHRPSVALAVLDAFEAGGNVGSPDTLLALRTVAEGQVVQTARSVEDLARFVESPLPETRMRAIFRLSRLESAEAELRIRRLLDDHDYQVRVTALNIYARPWLTARLEHDEELGRHVVQMLHRDENDLVRGAAAGLLSLVARPYAAEELIRTLVGETRDPEAYPRINAATALTRHDGVPARTALIDALDDPDDGVRDAAIKALFQIASTEHGYDPKGPPEERAAAIERWRRWLRSTATTEAEQGSR